MNKRQAKRIAYAWAAKKLRETVDDGGYMDYDASEADNERVAGALLEIADMLEARCGPAGDTSYETVDCDVTAYCT